MANGGAFKERLLREKKLVLVLDLDQTLLHSSAVADLSPTEQRLLLRDPAAPGLYRLPALAFATKIRPFVRTFLEEASRLFLLYVFTLAARPYAQEMAAILDPAATLLSGVFSREDCSPPGHKTLSAVPCDDALAAIVDDTPSAWPRHARNLVPVPPYQFFGPGGFGRRRADESETDGPLADALKALQRLHRQVFDPVPCSIDVRRVVREMRQEILRGCKIAFEVTTNAAGERLPILRMAEECGATCVWSVGVDVTHVVSVDTGAPKAHWAEQRFKFVVKPEWIEAAYYSWRRPPEVDFSLATLRNGTSVGPARYTAFGRPMALKGSEVSV